MQFISEPAPAIAPDWFARPSTQVAPDLLGCTLVRQLPSGAIIRGLIVETEAYAPGDPACHAYRRQTQRNAVMFGPAGLTYVYLIYGIYHCLNIVTDGDGVPSAVLLRALQLDAVSAGGDRAATQKLDRVAAGPGKLCRALQIDQTLNAHALRPNTALWVEHRSPDCDRALAQMPDAITQTTRIGLTQGVELPWRWYLTESKAVSKR